MSTAAVARTSLETIIKRQFEAFNRHDGPATAAGYDADAVVVDPQYPEPLKGRDAVKRDFVEFFNAFPDLKVTIGETMTDSDRYAFQFTMSGTHKGPLVGPSGHIPATGKKIEVGGGAFGRIGHDGKIVEEHRYYDMATLMGQLGLLQ